MHVGLKSSTCYDDLIDWQQGAATVLTLPGPRFIALAVETVGEDYFMTAPGQMAPRLAKFRDALGVWGKS